MRALSTVAVLGVLAGLAGSAFAQGAGSAGQGTGFSMTPPLSGYSAPSSPATGVQMTAPAQAQAPQSPSSQNPPSQGASPQQPFTGYNVPGSGEQDGPDAPVRGERLPSTGLGVPGESGAPAPSAAPFQMRPGQPAPAPVAAPSAPATNAPPPAPDRFVVPQTRMIFAGEAAARAWTINLTQEEASRQATFQLSYINAVVVMPEASRLRVSINGQTVLETPIASSSAPAHLSAQVPRGTLRTGSNLIRIDVAQRHRTDCNVNATYELWTEIDNEGTGLSFAGGRPPLSGGLDDLPAVGFDARGITTIRVVTPGPIEGGGSTRVLRAVQGLAVRGQFPNPAISIAEGAQGPTPKGGLTVVIGSAAELPRLMATVPADARQRPIATFLEDDRLGAPTLLISGPTPADVDRAIERLNDIAIPQTDAINTLTSWAPSAPLFTGAREVRLSDLGVPTQEFSGRRLRAEFQIALPPDFFAEAYGSANLYLDAAFTSAVRPGSHVDVYVNQQIASTLPITKRGGGLMQHEAIYIPLRNFRPGVNRLWLEVVLDTESDARCLPGATLPADNRFVLFDTSEFVMENFARIGRLPDLAAFAATSFPYNNDDSPIAVVLARQDASTLSAASTLMSRLAISNGAPLPIDASPASVTLGERNAIFVGGIDRISASVLEQVGIAESARSSWVMTADEAPTGTGSSPETASYDNLLERFRSRQAEEGAAAPPPPPPSPASGQTTPDVYERWRETVQGRGGLYSIVDGFEAWLQRTFSIGFSSLRIQEGQRTMWEPPARTSVLMAQGNSTNGGSAWTLVTARTSEALAANMVRFTADTAWNRVGGQAVAFQGANGEMVRRDISSYRFVITQPLNFANFRMIAANWLSTNIMPYALMLLVAGTLLGTATAFLLRRLGRPT